MLEWALQCARQGLRVHPLYEVGDDLVCRCWQREKCEEKARGKHPRLKEVAVEMALPTGQRAVRVKAAQPRLVW